MENSFQLSSEGPRSRKPQLLGYTYTLGFFTVRQVCIQLVFALRVGSCKPFAILHEASCCLPGLPVYFVRCRAATPTTGQSRRRWGLGTSTTALHYEYEDRHAITPHISQLSSLDFYYRLPHWKSFAKRKHVSSSTCPSFCTSFPLQVSPTSPQI